MADSVQGKGLYTVVGAYDDGRSAEELEKSITWDQAGNVQFLREKYKVRACLEHVTWIVETNSCDRIGTPSSKLLRS